MKYLHWKYLLNVYWQLNSYIEENEKIFLLKYILNNYKNMQDYLHYFTFERFRNKYKYKFKVISPKNIYDQAPMIMHEMNKTELNQEG